MKAHLLLAVCSAVLFAGCATTNDGRTGLRGEICAFGYCVTPQAMTASAVTVPQTAVVSGPVVAPATVLSQPVNAVAVQERTTVVQAPAPAYPPPISYNAPVMPVRPLEK